MRKNLFVKTPKSIESIFKDFKDFGSDVNDLNDASHKRLTKHLHSLSFAPHESHKFNKVWNHRFAYYYFTGWKDQDWRADKSLKVVKVGIHYSDYARINEDLLRNLFKIITNHKITLKFHFAPNPYSRFNAGPNPYHACFYIRLMILLSWCPDEFLTKALFYSSGARKRELVTRAIELHKTNNSIVKRLEEHIKDEKSVLKRMQNLRDTTDLFLPKENMQDVKVQHRQRIVARALYTLLEEHRGGKVYDWTKVFCDKGE